MKLNRGGLILCAVYSAVAIPLVVWVNFFPSNGPGALSGRLLVNALASAPALLLLGFTGLFDALFKISPWFSTVFFGFPLSLPILYLFGCALSWIPANWLEPNPRRTFHALDEE